MEPQKFFVSSCSTLKEGAGLVAGEDATITGCVGSSRPPVIGISTSGGQEPENMTVDHTEEVLTDDALKSKDAILNSEEAIQMDVTEEDESILIEDTSENTDKEVQVEYARMGGRTERVTRAERVTRTERVKRTEGDRRTERKRDEETSGVKESKAASGAKSIIPKFCPDFKIPRMSDRPRLNIKPAGFEDDPEECGNEPPSKSRRRKKYNPNRHLTREDVVTSFDDDTEWRKYASAANSNTSGSSGPATSDSSPTPGGSRSSSSVSTSDLRRRIDSNRGERSRSAAPSSLMTIWNKNEYLRAADSDPRVVQKAIEAYSRKLIAKEREELQRAEDSMWDICRSESNRGVFVKIPKYEGLVWTQRKKSDQRCLQYKARAENLLTPAMIRRRDKEFRRGQINKNAVNWECVVKERKRKEQELERAIECYAKELVNISGSERSLDLLEEERRRSTQQRRRAECRMMQMNNERWNKAEQEKFREEERRREEEREKSFRERIRKELGEKRKEKEKEKEENQIRREKEERERLEEQLRKEREEKEREEKRLRREKEMKEEEERRRRREEGKNRIEQQPRIEKKQEEEATKERREIEDMEVQEEGAEEEPISEGRLETGNSRREGSSCFDELGRRRRGNQFGGLNLIFPDPKLDPASGKCYVCWSEGHPHKNCLSRSKFRYLRYCYNCGRRNRMLWSCERCKDAHQLYRERKGLQNERAESEATVQKTSLEVRKRDRSESSSSQTVPPYKRYPEQDPVVPTVSYREHIVHQQPQVQQWVSQQEWQQETQRLTYQQQSTAPQPPQSAQYLVQQSHQAARIQPVQHANPESQPMPARPSMHEQQYQGDATTAGRGAQEKLEITLRIMRAANAAEATPELRFQLLAEIAKMMQD